MKKVKTRKTAKAKGKAKPKASKTRTASKAATTTRRALRAASGYEVVAAREEDRELLVVRAPNGQLCLKILLLPEGPVVEVQGQALRLASSGEIRLDCEQLAINVKKDV